MTNTDFYRSSTGEPHLIRRKELLKKYPAEVRALMGNDKTSALWVVGCVLSQLTIAYFLRDQSFWVMYLVAFCVGAFFNHALYVLVHEATHNLIFKHSVANRFIAMFCDFALFTPSAMAFRKFHLIHHTSQGKPELDADLCSEREANWVKNNPLKKTIWVLFLAVSQANRPSQLTVKPFFDRWIVFNLLLQAAFLFGFYQLVGFMGLGYLLASTLIGLGLHPMGGRWIAEHYVIHHDQNNVAQETYSYYGPLNKLCFNVGYHNEHHDVMTIPWRNLPKLKDLAPEYYETLAQHKSYPLLLWRFITDPTMSLKSRVIRE